MTSPSESHSMNSRRRIPTVLLATTISSFTTPFMGSSVNVALPMIARDYAMSALALSWVVSAFLLAAASMLLPIGRLADIHGRKSFFIAGSLLFAASSVLCLAAGSTGVFIAFRALQGVGGAMIFSAGTAMLVAAYPPEKRGSVLGINIAAVYIGLTVGPFIGGLLTEHIGWEAIFIFNTVLGLGAALAGAKTPKEEKPAAHGEKFDLIGSCLYVAALFSLMVGFSQLPRLLGGALIIAGATCFAFFIRRQLKLSQPLIHISLFLNNRIFAFSNLAALINYSATFAVTFLLSLYLQHVKLLTPSQTGLVLVVEPLLQAAFSPLAGRLSDRYDPRIIASAGMTLTVVGLFGLVWIGAETSLVQIAVLLAVLGIGFAFFSSPNVNAIMSSVDKKIYGIASATLATMRLCGQMVSMGIAMLVFSWIIGERGLGGENSALFISSAQWIFVILAGACVLGVFASLARGKVRS